MAMSQSVYSGGDGTGKVTGRVTLPSGKAMKHALAMFYLKQNGPPPLPERYWRVPDAVIPVEADGTFSVDLIEGEYYVGVMGRESSKLVPGPPAVGDYLMLVNDREGRPKLFSVVEGKTVNVGNQKSRIYRKTAPAKSRLTTVEGTVRFADGSPVPGAFVFAFHSPERRSKPVFASEKTGKSGRYVLRVDGAGPFYLKVRDVYGGGKPRQGQLIGTYGGEQAAAVTVDSGSSLKEIDIIVEQIQRSDGNGF